jgi:hypothetical protein
MVIRSYCIDLNHRFSWSRFGSNQTVKLPVRQSVKMDMGDKQMLMMARLLSLPAGKFK